MKKNHIFNIVLVGIVVGICAPVVAQDESPTLRQRALTAWRNRPNVSLPAWAKGPGFEAAKKWWKAGRNESVLSKKEKKAFNRLKKRVKIGAVVAAVAAFFGGRYLRGRYQVAQVRRREKEWGQKMRDRYQVAQVRRREKEWGQKMREAREKE
jgi:hypothetical protein